MAFNAQRGITIGQISILRQGCQLLSSGMSETAGSAPIITETERDGGGGN